MVICTGIADSGKSTFCKQMTIVHGEKFSDEELAKYAALLRENAVSSMKELLTGAEGMGLKLPKSLQKAITIVRQATELDEDIAAAIKAIWNDKVIKKAWKKRGQEYNISCNADYYFDNVERFAAKDYVPTNDDVMRARLLTTSVRETKFTVQQMKFTLIDVGGQRSQRRKWWHFFEDVTAVIYLAALDDYDMVLEEDNTVNRMLESLRVFSELTRLSVFKNTSFILFLNKSDLFRIKIENPKRSLSNLFPEYRGGPDFDKGVRFIRSKYRNAYRGQNTLYFHTTCALDRNNCERVFAAVRDTLLREHMKQFGM